MFRAIHTAMRFPNKHTARDKHLLRLERELRRLSQATRDAPIIPLEHPYQRGWIKTYRIRADAYHHPDIAVFQAVFAVVNQAIKSRHYDFTHKNGGFHRLYPRIIPPGEWIKRPWPISHQRLFAYGHWELEEIFPWRGKHQRHWIKGFRLLRTWWLEEIVLPLMITHQQVELPEVRSRMAEIEAYFTTHRGRERLSRLHGRSAQWRDSDPPIGDLRSPAAGQKLHLQAIIPD